MRAGACGLLAIAVLAVAGCGSGGPAVVATVAGTPVTKAQLDHWVKVTAAGDPPKPGTSRSRTLQQQALRFLISVAWLTGEARARGIDVSPNEVRQAVARQVRATFPGGQSELRSYQSTTGQTAADRRLEAQAQLAAARVRSSVLGAVASPTAAEVASYYRQNLARYAVPERREVLITNRKTVAFADRVKRAVAAGRSFSTYAHKETFTIGPIAPNDSGRPLKRAIAAAKVGVLVGPIKARVDDFVFELRRVMPPRHERLGEVAGAIAAQLAGERRARALAAFEASWSATWRAQTDCHAGYVVQLCRQYRGPQAAVAFKLQ